MTGPHKLPRPGEAVTASTAGRAAGSHRLVQGNAGAGCTARPGTPGREWHVPLPYDTPPLNANQRMHHQQRARITRQLRRDAGWGARGRGIPPLTRCRVELHYVPRDGRRRDADNLTPTLKAACDGLVDARVVPDDTPSYMDKAMPVIHEPEPRRARTRLYLIVTDLGGTP